MKKPYKVDISPSELLQLECTFTQLQSSAIESAFHVSPRIFVVKKPDAEHGLYLIWKKSFALKRAA
jgi:hypothetical protein